MRTTIHIALLLVSVAFVQLAAAEAWAVPAEEAAKTNPVEANAETLKQGKALYTEHCLDCHGATGAGDGDGAALLGIEMKSLADPTVVALSDGALHYMTAVGRGDMPGYVKDKVLSAEQVWQLVIYMRSLAPAK